MTRINVSHNGVVVGYLYASPYQPVWHGWHRDSGCTPRGGETGTDALREMVRYATDPCRYYRERFAAMESQAETERLERARAHEARKRR